MPNNSEALLKHFHWACARLQERYCEFNFNFDLRLAFANESRPPNAI